MIDHPARIQVAETLVELNDGNHARGSAYLVAPGWALTADHVVHGATGIGVWFGAPSELREAEGLGVDPRRVLRASEADLALLAIDPEVTNTAVDAVLFGRLDRDLTEPVPAVAAGFPRFKLRPGSQGKLLRDLHFATGTIAAGSNIKTGTYEFAVHMMPDEDPGHSPWEGMSGAAVWAGGRLIGVVGQHYPGENRATLTVRPIEALFTSADPTQLSGWRAALNQLSARVEDLWTVRAPATRDLPIRRANQAAKRLAPQVLIARDTELSSLAEFTGSKQQWRWVRGDAFAGKTALLAQFALHPPETVDIAACFLRSTSGENTLDYALNILTGQLAAFARLDSRPQAQYPHEKISSFLELLELATRASDERNRRLLLLVDGLDEYQTAGLDLAAWLPDASTLPHEASLLVSSREMVDVDVPSTHPLRHHAYHLSASDAATEIQAMASKELAVAVGNPGGLGYPILGFLAAADGGLTRAELGALVQKGGRNAYVAEIDTLVHTTLRRSLIGISDSDGDAEEVHVFAHDTLMSEACALFEGDLPFFRNIIYGWADSYAQDRWPVTTPRYLLAPYAKMLNNTGDPARLAVLATNHSRHERMLARTLGDGAALAEIADAQELHLAQPGPNLTILTLLAIERDRLIHRNQAVPDGLPALWVQLGEPQHGQALARSLADPLRQAAAWARLAAALATTGQTEQAAQAAQEAERASDALSDPWLRARTSARMAKAFARDLPEQAERAVHEAERASHEIIEPRQRAAALARLASAFAAGGLLRESEQAADSIEDPATRVAALTDLTKALGAAGHTEKAKQAAHRAESAATEITEPMQQARALAGVVSALAATGRSEEAEQVAIRITVPGQRVLAFSHLATSLAKDSKLRHAEEAVNHAKRAAASIADPMQQAAALSHLVGALAVIGQMGEAEQAAARITEPTQRARAFSRLASRAVGRHPELAVRAIHQAECAAASISDPGQEAAVLVDLADALAAAGYLEQAVRAAAKISDLTQRARVLTHLAAALNAAGRREQALRTARDAQLAAASVTNPQQQAAVLADLANALAGAGCLEQALQAAVDISEHTLQAETLARLGDALLAAGQVERAEWAAAHISDSGQRARALTRMVGALTAAEHLDQAVKAAVHIAKPGQRALALAEVAAAFVGAKQREQAERAAQDAQQAAAEIADPGQRARVLARVAATLAGTSQREQAERAAQDAATEIADPGQRARVLARVAATLTGTSQREQAERAGREAQQPVTWTSDLYSQAGVPLTLDDVANELAIADRLEQLGRVAADISDPVQRDHAFVRLAAELDAVGLLEEGDRARAFGRLAVRLARFGQVEQAKRKANDAQRIAEGITDPMWRTRGLVELVETFIAAQQLDWAERAATNIHDPVLRAVAFANLMGARTAAGQILLAKRISETAQHAALSIADSVRQASALIRLAEEYTRINSEECMMAAYKLCGLVLTGPAWRRALPLIGSLDAQCLVTVVSQLAKEN